MADKGPYQQRRPPEEAATSREQRRDEGPDSAQAGLHDSVVNTRGASAGAVAPGPPTHQEQERRREGDSASGMAEFFQRLTDLAELHEEDGGDLDLEAADEEHVEVGGSPQSAGPVGGQRGSSRASQRGSAGGRAGRARKERGGDGEPDEPAARAATAEEDSGAPPPPRIRPGKRAASIELQALLEHGVELGLIGDYQSSCIDALLLKLTWDDFDDLQEALDRCDTQVQRILVLAALSAHRAPAWLPEFALELSGHSEQELLLRCSWRHGAERPGEGSGVGTIRQWYDPMSRFEVGNRPEHELETEEVWTVPKWLRGVPVGALEMSALAFEQTLRGEFFPDQERADGANDLLTRALELHGSSHPALERWLLSLCARSQSRGGLLSARNALIEARNQSVGRG